MCAPITSVKFNFTTQSPTLVGGSFVKLYPTILPISSVSLFFSASSGSAFIFLTIFSIDNAVISNLLKMGSIPSPKSTLAGSPHAFIVKSFVRTSLMSFPSIDFGNGSLPSDFTPASAVPKHDDITVIFFPSIVFCI